MHACVCYYVTVLLCYCVIVLLCYCVTVLLCYCVTVLLCYYVTVLLLIGVFCNRVGLRWNVVGDMPVWLGNSVVRVFARSGKDPVFDPCRATLFHLLHVLQQDRKYISCVTLFLAFCRFNWHVPKSLFRWWKTDHTKTTSAYVLTNRQ